MNFILEELAQEYSILVDGERQPARAFASSMGPTPAKPSNTVAPSQCPRRIWKSDSLTRSGMGRVVAERADLCIVTSDNPRTENPQRILEDIAQGMGSAPYRSIAGRQEAIFTALNEARRDDVVLIAGKGHEDYPAFNLLAAC